MNTFCEEHRGSCGPVGSEGESRDFGNFQAVARLWIFQTFRETFLCGLDGIDRKMEREVLLRLTMVCDRQLDYTAGSFSVFSLIWQELRGTYAVEFTVVEDCRIPTKVSSFLPRFTYFGRSRLRLTLRSSVWWKMSFASVDDHSLFCGLLTHDRCNVTAEKKTWFLEFSDEQRSRQIVINVFAPYKPVTGPGNDRW